MNKIILIFIGGLLSLYSISIFSAKDVWEPAITSNINGTYYAFELVHDKTHNDISTKASYKEAGAYVTAEYKRHDNWIANSGTSNSSFATTGINYGDGSIQSSKQTADAR